MKQLTVAYKQMDHINNHELLLPSMEFTPPGHQEPIQVVVHRDPVCHMVGPKVRTNYDFVVSVTPEPDLVRNVVLERYSKLTQAAHLLEAVQRADRFPNFMPIRCWDNRFSTHNDADSFHIDKVIIKSTLGARGICQLLVEEVVGVNKATLLTQFQQTLNKFNEQPSSHNSADEHNTAFREYFKANFPHKALWSGLEQQDMGSLSSLMYSGNYFMQECCRNILKEYRVLVGAAKELYCFERGWRDDRPFQQATGTHKSIFTRRIPAPSPELDEELQDFLSTVIPAMNSTDVVLFETPNGVRYGIFEYCNQFGMDTDDPAIFRKMHSDFIAHHAKIYRPDLFA